ncbi:tRNA-specific adenosine-34 deaminase [hydrothermal vent metagenome]|uniref:tRNA-specific adenosine deaminase 2 n=1 Tax=hydrothermal vent metagenome TaxID=652676 RepID=A0A3B0ZTR5_9ZZZZ
MKQPMDPDGLSTQHVHWMQMALDLAIEAAEADEVPVGAVLVKDNVLVSRGRNQPIATQDPSAHAEIVALRNGGHHLANYRLPGTTLYVTLEPCAMCLGAIVHARVQDLVFGAYDLKSGMVCSTLKLLDVGKFNHQLNWTGGIMQEECSQLLKSFFRSRRN